MNFFNRFLLVLGAALPLVSCSVPQNNSSEKISTSKVLESVSSVHGNLFATLEGYNKGGFVGSLFGAKWACQVDVFFDAHDRMTLRIQDADEPGMGSGDFEKPSMDLTLDFGNQSKFKTGQYAAEEVRLTGPDNVHAKFGFSSGKLVFAEVKRGFMNSWWCENF